jgi:hypothetical protein
MASKKYALPAFLENRCPPEVYVRWLDRKAKAHIERDRKRGNTSAMREAYMLAIHEAVTASGGLDEYTGEPLAWQLISTYDNDKSKAGRREYKRTFALLPTVDHVGDGLAAPDFKICSWRSNDCKNDLSHEELLDFCRAVLTHHFDDREADAWDREIERDAASGKLEKLFERSMS